MVGVLSLTFLGGVFIAITPISHTLGYTDHPEYILMMATVVALDAIQAIPFCLLRYQKKAVKFASLKLLFIVMNIGLNLLYFKVLGHTEVYYVFFLNLICTGLITFFFIPDLLHMQVRVDLGLLRRMFSYSWPILLLGIAGILNQAADKMIFPLVYPDKKEAISELAIYGACVKVAMIMAMITQAFRYAYEPFVFAQSKEQGQTKTYALGMKYFVIFTLMAFLCVMAWLPALRYMVGADYWEGLRVVPIVMAAEIMMGIYFNLSFWYKLIDKTIYGAFFSIVGCVILLAVNLWGIPHMSYMACAWGGFAGYGSAMILSYIVGQKLNPIPYPLRSMACYLLLAGVLFILIELIPNDWSVLSQLALGTILVGVYATYTIRTDMPLRNIPVLGKYFRKR